MTSSPHQTSYDDIPYVSSPFSQTHPDRLAVMGRLFGMSPAPVAHCRVLELGCAAGGNLIPMAYQLPESDFVGVDLSGRQVATGDQMIRDLDLKNIRLVHADLMQVDEAWGIFDYIICHGVFSWVPDHVQEHIFTISSQNLAPDGIAYISYNTYPGWHIREMVRRMMLFHAGLFENPSEKIDQARALIDFLAHSVPTENNYFGMMLRSELDLIQRSRDSYLFHEHLETINSPLYFFEFMQRAEKHGLQYLGEAYLSSMMTSMLPKETEETLLSISPSMLHMEQYMDFIRNRPFRQTLLCRKDHKLRRNLDNKAVEGLMMASAAYPLRSDIDPAKEGVSAFQAPSGATIETGSALTKAALLVLREDWPKAVALPVVVEKAENRLQGTDALKDYDLDRAKAVLVDDLLHCHAANAVEFHTWQADFATQAGLRPKVITTAAYQAKHGMPVVNQRHEPVSLDLVSKEIIKLADGTRTKKELFDALNEAANTGALSFNAENGPEKPPAPDIRHLKKVFNKTWLMLERSALLDR